MNKQKYTIEKYMAFDYPFIVVPFHEEGFRGYRAFLIDIPAVESIGTTPEEALHDLNDVKKEWLTYAKKTGLSIPEPNPDFPVSMTYSGRVTLRISKTLHRQISEKAHLDGVSLNTYINEAILRGMNAV